MSQSSNPDFEYIAAHINDYVNKSDFFNEFKIADIKKILQISNLTAKDFISFLKLSHATIKTSKLYECARDAHISIRNFEEVISVLKSIKKYMKLSLLNSIINFLEHKESEKHDSADKNVKMQTTEDFIAFLKLSHQTIKASKLYGYARNANVSVQNFEDVLSILRSIKKYMKLRLLNGIIDFLEQNRNDVQDSTALSEVPDQTPKSDNEIYPDQSQINQTNEDIQSLISGLQSSIDFDSVYDFFDDLSSKDDKDMISIAINGRQWEKSMHFGRNVLHIACQRGNMKLVKFLIDSGCDIETKDCGKNTPLICASQEGHLEIVRYLITSGAEKEAKNNDGNTALLCATLSGCLEVVQYLISAGADKESKNIFGETPLIIASKEGHLEVVQYLISVGADKESKDNNGNNALNCASNYQRMDICDYLLSIQSENNVLSKIIELKNSNDFDIIYKFLDELSYKNNQQMIATAVNEGLISKKNGFGRNVLHVACQYGNLKLVISLIESGCDKDEKDVNGYTPLIWASKENHLEVVKYLISAGADKEAKEFDGYTPLIFASIKGHLEVVKYLISAGANKEAKTNDGYTSLIGASFKGQLEVVKYLISVGVDKEAKSIDGNTALIFASKNGHFEIVKYLISVGANKDAKNNVGKTPFVIAIESIHLEIANYLNSIQTNQANQSDQSQFNQIDEEIKSRVSRLMVTNDFKYVYNFLEELSSGDDKNAFSYTINRGLWKKKNEYKRNVVHVACEKGNLQFVKSLIECGCDKETKTDDGETPLNYASIKGHLEVVKYLISKGADKEARNNDGDTPLSVASRYGNLEAVKYFISIFADKETKNKRGETPLICASRYNRLDVLKYLISIFADKEAKANDGYSALGWSSYHGHLDAVKCLISTGADKEIKNKRGETPLIIASKEGHLEVVKYLVSSGANIKAKAIDGKTALNYASEPCFIGSLRTARNNVKEYLVSVGAE